MKRKGGDRSGNTRDPDGGAYYPGGPHYLKIFGPVKPYFGPKRGI